MLQYPVALGVVIPAERIERSHLHPATTQFFIAVVEETTDVSSNLENRKHKEEVDIYTRYYRCALCTH